MSKPILIVDDNPNMSALLVEMLEVFDFRSVVASDGEEALEAVEKEEFALVITDLRMPKISGLELIDRIKANHPELPIALISGYNIEELEAEGVRDKADGFLSKPFMISDIEQLLASLT
ncbi:MAG: response regulator [candidate division Zixibacteria bacterium]|nr:response regulator [candidate division Zixibacteria bacterium]